MLSSSSSSTSSSSSSLLSARFPSLTSTECACLLSVAGDIDSAGVLAQCSVNRDTASRISLCGASAGHCGYCNGTRRGTRATFGLIAETLDVYDYDDMINRGFRRSGTYCYAATPIQTADMCCAQYAIRLNVKRFKPTKSQRNTANKLKRLTEPPIAATTATPPPPKRVRRSLDGAVNTVRVAVERLLRAFGADDSVVRSISSKTRVYTRDDVNGTTNAVALITAQYKERAPTDIGAALADAIKHSASTNKFVTDAHFDQSAPQLKLILAASDNDDAKSDDDTLAPPSTSTSTFTLTAAFPSAHSLQVSLHASAFDAESFCLYRRYQTAVHGDAPEEVSERGYTRFLCKSPLTSATPPYGSYHQRYRVDGKLIAVSVIDILPTCISSVYVFYDPTFTLFSLGAVTALRDIESVQKLGAAFPRIEYYVLGLYIHSCSKMRYKAEYAPSELLCPLRLSWHDYTLAQRMLERSDVVMFSDAAALTAADEYRFDRRHVLEQWKRRRQGARDDISNIPVVMPGARSVIRIKSIESRIRGEFEDLLIEYAAVVGKALAHKLLVTV